MQSLRPRASSAFALTESGLRFAGAFVPETREAIPDRPLPAMRLGRLVPRYERDGRLFCWGQHVVKWLRRPACNQETILLAAEEEGWPTWLANPLPVAAGTTRNRRLNATLKDLNRGQESSLIHFRGDGSGRRLGWEPR